MSFASYDFLFYFLPSAVALTLLAGAIDGRRLLVPAFFLVSLVFYSLNSVPHLLLLLGLVAISWLCGWGHDAFKAKGDLRTARGAILLGVLVNLAGLSVWKYGSSLIAIWNGLGVAPATDPGLLIPLGISFYSLQQIGFLLDLRRGRARLGRPLDYASFITFFPQLLSGPIVTQRRMEREFARVQEGLSWTERLDMAVLGLSWIAIGLFKKVVLADNLRQLTTPLVEQAAVADISPIHALQIALAACPQIYFDFCGYSDMAVGLGLLFGVRLPYNFNAPQRTSSNREGWKRWHITFHDFVRDHVYRPLHKRLKAKPGGQVFVLLLVFSISALWHGDGPRYIVWGLLTFATFFLLNTASGLLPASGRRWVEQPARIAMAMSFPLIFLSPDLSVAMKILGQALSFGALLADPTTATLGNLAVTALLVGVMACWLTEISTQVLLTGERDHPDRTFFGLRVPEWSPNLPWAAMTILLLITSFYFVGASRDFFYYQF